MPCSTIAEKLPALFSSSHPTRTGAACVVFVLLLCFMGEAAMAGTAGGSRAEDSRLDGEDANPVRAAEQRSVVAAKVGVVGVVGRSRGTRSDLGIDRGRGAERHLAGPALPTEGLMPASSRRSE